MALLTYNPNTNPENEIVQMPFQKNATARLTEIFTAHSRAFLADEAGLGKTYTATGVMEQLADQQWAEQGEGNETPFYALYVAPNQALLNKCCADIVEKGRTEGEIIWLENCDRLLHLPPTPALNNQKKIVLLATSIHVLGGIVVAESSSSHGSKQEKTLVSELTEAQWEDYKKRKLADDLYWVRDGNGYRLCNGREFHRMPIEIQRLQQYGFGLAIFDEYHRYFAELSNAQSVFDYEQENKCKVLFISATPYQGNMKDVDTDDDTADEDGTDLVTLPSLADFEQKFCDGLAFSKSHFSQQYKKRGKPDCLACADSNYKEALSDLADAPEDATLQQQAQNAQNALQTLLRERMVRHERTQLSAGQTPEPHTMLFTKERQNPTQYKTQIMQMRHQSLALQRAGYNQGAQNWSRSMPWLLSFSTNYKTAITKDKKSNYFKILDPEGRSTAPDSRLFYSNEKIHTLPQQNIAFFQMCQANVTAELAQLIWMPPTIPAYQIPQDSLFAKCKNHSKLLVFGEYKYLQRGGAMLLSEYARHLNNCGCADMDFSLAYANETTEIFAHPPIIDCKKSMDELVKTWQYEFLCDEKTALAYLASPACCAQRLGLDATAVEEAFNQYFKRKEIKNAMLSWALTHHRSRLDKNCQLDWQWVVLRYCAEGNLYAVLREWKTTNRLLDAAHISAILSRAGTSVHIQTPVTYQGKQEGKLYTCAFADRLTQDPGDVGTSNAEDSHLLTQQAFNSPFYPMVLFAGRGAQEGLDFHQYCLRIMHLTLPRGAVSFDQRQGRIDRYRSLLVRRRAAEVFGNLCCADPKVYYKVFNQLKAEKDTSCDIWKDDQLFPNWQIKEYGDYKSDHHFQRLVPIADYTHEALTYAAMEHHLFSYRSTIGSSGQTLSDSKLQINLSAP